MGVEKSNVAAPKRLILAASVAAFCGGLAAPAQADMETLLEKLRAKASCPKRNTRKCAPTCVPSAAKRR